MKVIDISSVDYLAEATPNPYRWLYAGFVLAVTVPVGLISVAASTFFESKSSDSFFDSALRREETRKNDYLSRDRF